MDIVEQKIEQFDGDCEKALASVAEENMARGKFKVRLFNDLISAIETHIKDNGLKEAIPCLLALEYPEYLKKNIQINTLIKWTTFKNFKRVF